MLLKIMKKIELSIIVPVYNVCDCLENCVNSLLKQQVDGIEILLVDDGSTDGSAQLCDKLAENSLIRAIHQENQGLSGARRKGVRMANGDYIGFVDPDDWVSDEYYEKMLNYIYEEHLDICVSAISLSRMDEERMGNVWPKGVYGREQAMRDLSRRHCSVINSSFCNKLFSKKLLLDADLFRDMLYEDLATMHQILDKCDRVGFCPDSIYHYCYRDGSICHSDFSEKNLDEFEAYKLKYLYYKKYYKEYADVILVEWMFCGIDLYAKCKLNYRDTSNYKYLLIHDIKNKTEVIIKSECYGLERVKLFFALYANRICVWIVYLRYKMGYKE